jgi:hypothetical protein
MRKREKAKGRRQTGSFLMLHHSMLEHRNFLRLSSHACKALLLIAGQYKGYNNGDLQATQRLALKSGWTSRGTFCVAITELELAGFIVRSRQGGRNRCSLYAITWQPIDDRKGKLDISATKVATNEWRGTNGGPPMGQLDPPAGQSGDRTTLPTQD